MYYILLYIILQPDALFEDSTPSRGYFRSQKYINNVTTRTVTKNSVFLSLKLTLTLTNNTDLTELEHIYKQF